MEYESWYALWCPRQIRKFAAPKILTQVLASRAAFALDPDGSKWFAGGGNAGVYGVIPGPRVELLYLLAVLNSTSFDEMLQSSSSRFRGGYFSYAKRFIERIPIPVPSEAIQRRVCALVEKRLVAVGSAADAIETELDAAVRDLYAM